MNVSLRPDLAKFVSTRWRPAVTTRRTPPSTPPSRAFPAEFPAWLRSLDAGAVATQWAAAMSTPEHTHSVTGHKLSDGWTAGQALEILKPLFALAHRATAGQQLYLLTEA